MKMLSLRMSGTVLFAMSMFVNQICAQAWSPTPMVIDVEDHFEFHGPNLEIPFSLSGKPGKLWLVIESKLYQYDRPEAIRNGFKGWHFINNTDTTLYVSAPRTFDIGDNIFPTEIYGEGWSGIFKSATEGDGASNPYQPDDISAIYNLPLRYYIWGYDYQAERELVCDFIPIGNYWEAQYMRFYAYDDTGAPYDAPMLMGQLPFFHAETIGDSFDGILGKADMFKWTLGTDPYATNQLVTSHVSGYTPNEIFEHPDYDPIENPGAVYTIGYGAGVFDPNDHDVFYFTENRWWEHNQTVVKYTFNPNGEATKDLDWGGYDNGPVWDHPGNNKDYSKHSVLYNLGDDKLIMLDGGQNPHDYQHDRLHVISKDDPTDEFFDIQLEEFYMPDQPVDPISGDTRTSSELNRLAPGKREGTFYITGEFSCLTELIDISRLADAEGDLDPYSFDGTGYVVWANSNGDYFFDMSAFPDPENPTQQWACIVSDPRNNNNPRRNLSPADRNGFMVSFSEFTGVNSFGVYCPDGTGMAMAGFGDDTYFTGGDNASERGGGTTLDYGGQFDGMYVPPSLAGTIGGPDVSLLKTTWIACDSDMGYIDTWWGYLEFGWEDRGAKFVNEVSPTVFSVAQNSPNPFNPTTTISFTLPEAGQVSVDVYNVGGQKVDTLLDESMTTGSHSVVWDAGGYSAGVYFYTVSAAGYSKTMKMTLVK